MTFYYRSTTSGANQKPDAETMAYWEAAAVKSNWRITQLSNGYYQAEVNYNEKWNPITRRETVEGTESAIDASVEHFAGKLEFAKGPKVVKTF
jgi:hypothetical protein